MLTLEEIQNISFRRSGLGGYRTDDVDTFTDQVIETVRSLERTKKELESSIESKDAQIKEYKKKEDSVQDAIISAQMTAKQIVMEATSKSDEKLSKSKEESEKLLRDAKEESDRLVREAQEKADKLVLEAQKRADQLNTETNAKIEEVMNKALRESSAQIEENNEILEAQKKSIICLMGEARKFRNTLVQAYREHLKEINEIVKADDISAKRKELDESYPPSVGNKPVELAVTEPAVAEPVAVVPSEEENTSAEIVPEKTEAVSETTENESSPVEEPVAEPTEEKKVASAITTEETAAKEEADTSDEVVIASSGTDDKASEIRRQPVRLGMDPGETSFGSLRIDDNNRNNNGFKKSGKHNKKRR